MRPTYTLVTTTAGYEALYARGELLKQAEDGKLTAAEVLDALSMHNISVGGVDFIEVADEYDEEVIAMSGWPSRLDEIPESARV